MESLLDPITVAIIRAPPETSVELIHFRHSTSAKESTQCRLYYTPTDGSKHFSPPQEAEENAFLNSSEELDILPQPDIIFNHGHRNGLDVASLVAFSEGFARTQTCLSFVDFGDLEHRTSTFRSLMSAFPSAAVGGRSYGSRSSCRAAIWSPVRKLIFFTYPLVRGIDERYEELLQLSSDVDVLFVVGDSDPLCVEMHLAAIRKRMRARTWWIRVIGADHQFSMRGNNGAGTKLCNVAGQIAAKWNVEGGRDLEKTELTLQYDKVNKQAVWTEWFAHPDLKKVSEKPITVTITLSGGSLPAAGEEFAHTLSR